MSLGKKEQDVAGQDFTNAATAMVLLKEWLSISESQICSTEVLTDHLPKINNLLETSMNSISLHFGNVARSGSEIGEEIKHLSAGGAVVEIEGNKIPLTEYINNITSGMSDFESIGKLQKLQAAIENHEKMVAEEIVKVRNILEKNTAEISEIVVGMQFQDRVSQNIMITINIMKTIAEFMDKEIGRSLPNISKEDRKKLLNKDFSKELLQKFRLGELQHAFVEHLVQHGYIENATEIGFSPKDHNKEASSDVELF